MTVRIYVTNVDQGYEWLIPHGEPHRWLVGDGESRAATWQPDEVSVLTDDDGRPRKHADVPWMAGGVLVLSPRAFDATRELLSPWGEFLPVRTVEGRDYQVFNPLVLCDALDEELSDIVRLDSGLVLSIKKHVFRPGKLPPASVFGLSQLRNSDLYLTGDLVDQLSAFGFRGTTFTLVWQSPTPTEREPGR